MSPGVGLENKGHQGSHIYNFKGGVRETRSTPTLKVYQIYFYRDKEVERLRLFNRCRLGLSSNVSEYSHSFSDIVKFYVAEGVDFDYYKQKCLYNRR